MTNRLDLPHRYRDRLETLLRQHVPDTEVWAYGSRVNGRSHDGSDLDLVLRSPTLEPLGYEYVELVEALEESNIPILVQAHDWARLPESFHREIERTYVVIQGKGRQEKKDKWHKVVLGDVVTLQLSSVDKKSKAGERAVQLCNYMDVYANNFIQCDMDFMAATATDGEITNCSLFPGDVIITKDSEKHDDIGVPALVREKVPDLVCGYHLAILRANTSVLDGAYLFYALSADSSQRQFHSFANGITRFGLRKADIEIVEIPLPPLPVQQAIVHILGALDDKIELNRRMNETLEAMARAIFQDWFVDFGPVRAKLGGRDPYLPADLWDLFPDRLVDSELGEIPEGWEVKALGDAVEILSGGTPKTSAPNYWDGGIPWYTAKDAPSLSDIFVLTTERFITQAGVDNSSTKILPAGTTIISARGTVGRLACLGIPMAMNQTCYGVRGVEGYPDFFTYWNVRSTVNELKTKTHGTIFDTITRETFKIAKAVLAPTDVAQAFESVIAPVMDRVLGNLKQTRSIAAQRDVLLPKLVSGELEA